MLVLLILIGFLGVVRRVDASAYSDCIVGGLDVTQCKGMEGDPSLLPTTPLPVIPVATPGTGAGATSTLTGQPLTTGGPKTPAEKSEFEKWAIGESCGIIGDSSVSGCIKAAFYYVVYTPSAVLLALSAQFFNALIALTLNSTFFTKSNFLPTAWAVVRDLSNIFFILILLYIAIKVILGLGGSDVKRMIAKVVIIALLINFSMFFTQVIVDTSNILALIFYNKLDVTYVDSAGNQKARNYDGLTGKNERDISGTMYNGFDITSKLNNPAFWKEVMSMSTISTASGPQTATQVPVGTMVGILVVASAIMVFAAYAFFVSGIAFVSRLIELFVLIIFSPFAFMSSTIPFLSTVESIGWDSWFKRLLKVAFMAPIFMFFMYLIFKLLDANLFGSLIVGKGWVETLLGVIIPGMTILILLLKATSFAKKGSGEMGEMVFKGAKMVGGFALGAATGGAALVGTKIIGGQMANRLSKNYGESLKEKANETGFGGWAARKGLKAIDTGTKATFDLRKAPGMGTLAGKAGLNLQSASIMGLGSKEGGFKGAVERQEEKLKKESELYKTGKTNAEVIAWSDKRQKEYEEGKRITKQLQGGSFNEKEYERMHERPKEYKTADELNKDRLTAFKDNIGQSDLLGTIAFKALKANKEIIDKNTSQENLEKDTDYKKQYAKKYGTSAPVEYNEDVAKAVNKAKINNVKMVAGGIAGLATGGLMGAGALGYLATPSYATTEGAAKFSKELEKGFEKMAKVTDRIAENITTINNLKALKAEGNELIKDNQGKPVILVKEDGSVDTEEIENQLAKLVTIEKFNDLELKKLSEAGHKMSDDTPEGKRMTALFNEGVAKIKMTARLNKLKTVTKEIHDRETENLNLGDKKAAIEKDQAGGAPKEKATPSTPKAKEHKKEESAHPPEAKASAPAASSGNNKGGGGDEHHK